MALECRKPSNKVIITASDNKRSTVIRSQWKLTVNISKLPVTKTWLVCASDWLRRVARVFLANHWTKKNTTRAFVFILNSHWLPGIFLFVLTGRDNKHSFCFTTCKLPRTTTPLPVLRRQGCRCMILLNLLSRAILSISAQVSEHYCGFPKSFLARKYTSLGTRPILNSPDPSAAK